MYLGYVACLTVLILLLSMALLVDPTTALTRLRRVLPSLFVLTGLFDMNIAGTPRCTDVTSTLGATPL